MEKANKRIAIIQHDLAKIDKVKAELVDSDDEDDEDDLDDKEGLLAELRQLEEQNIARQKKLDEYAKNKKWNIDNMFEVKEERTVVNPKAASYTKSGFVKPEEDLKPKAKETKAVDQKPAAASTTAAAEATKPVAAKAAPKAAAKPKKPVGPKAKEEEVGAFETYHEFTERHADTVEAFMAIPDLESSRQFLLEYADVLLQENAYNYLLLATLEDEMNGHREKMKRTARQSQIVTNIAELAKTMDTHPGNVIMPFFQRLQQREHLEEFLKGVNEFIEKIIKRAVVKKEEIDEQRRNQAVDEASTDLADIPLEQRLGPGGLDPLDVIETLPESMVKAFESRDVEQLKQALMALDPEEAERHMKRCVDSGLWVANAPV